MAYTLQRKETATSPWMSVGSGYSEGQAFRQLEQMKARYPKAMFRILDQKTKQLVYVG